MGLKPSTIEKTKFEYSPLGKIFNKGLNKKDKEEGLLKKLKKIEDKNEQLLRIKNKTENIKDVTDFVREPLMKKIKIIQKDINYRKLMFKGGDNVMHDFSD